MTEERRVLEELERLRASPYFYQYVHQLTVDSFWRARTRGRQEFDARAESQLKSYFGDAGFLEVKHLIEKEAARSR